jgi:serine/threonine protein kinase
MNDRAEAKDNRSAGQKPARRSSRFIYPKTAARRPHQSRSAQKNQNPQNGHLIARFDWGSGAICFGASPVAAVFGSAPGSATSPEHRIHSNPSLLTAPLKQDISTLLGIGHYYFALTISGSHARRGRKPVILKPRVEIARALPQALLASMAIQVGDKLGDYEVTGLLGAGGMGRVYRVRNALSGREEAMKVVLPDLDERPELADRFLREIQVHASLVHPNIAAMHTALRIEGRIVMLLELVEGVSLADRVRQGRIPVPDAIRYIDQVLSALDFAHGRGVIHRDLKPANILLTPEGSVKLTDFGIARAASQSHLTMTGMALGSLPYMSPEQIRSLPVDARSDIYSLGATFYEIVTGKRPLQGDSEYTLMNAQLNDVPPPPADVAPDIPRAISNVIMQALEKEPGRRFQSARDFQAALRGAPRTGTPAAFPTPSAIAPEDLARMEARLSRVLGPIAPRLVADASRKASNTTELSAALAQFIDNSAEREAFLRSCQQGATTTSTPRLAAPTVGAAPTVKASAAPGTWDPAMLAKASQALAAHIGPIAKVVVNRAAKKARTEEELYAALAAEIPEEGDRKRFAAALRK